MSEDEQNIAKRFLEEDDAPEWTEETFSRAELRHGDMVIRPATGTLKMVTPG